MQRQGFLQSLFEARGRRLIPLFQFAVKLLESLKRLLVCLSVGRMLAAAVCATAPARSWTSSSTHSRVCATGNGPRQPACERLWSPLHTVPCCRRCRRTRQQRWRRRKHLGQPFLGGTVFGKDDDPVIGPLVVGADVLFEPSNQGERCQVRRRLPRSSSENVWPSRIGRRPGHARGAQSAGCRSATSPASATSP